jgi:LysM repeat protein
VAPKAVAQSTTNDKRWANWFSQQQPAPQSATKTGSSTYTVRSGDTLSVIARRHGVSIATLAQANNLTNPNALRIGQVLTIPSAAGSSAVAAPVISAPAATTPAAPAAAPAAPVTAGGYYTVAKGDTLSGIARRHGTTIAKIMQANRMTTAQAHKLSIGQKIIIPNN